ncbi:MAG: hypothetical protein GY868_14735 [Deltaproteobacteria bacterium]|nr:hypothetical protein [Deltaproteobacteria bacterium]
MNIKTRFFKFGICVTWTCCMMVLLSAMTASADESLGRDMALVYGKSPNSISITEHRYRLPSEHVYVSTSAVILDADGKELVLKQLRVPCVARIRLSSRAGQSYAELVRLEVREYKKNAASRLTRHEPLSIQPH